MVVLNNPPASSATPPLTFFAPESSAAAAARLLPGVRMGPEACAMDSAERASSRSYTQGLATVPASAQLQMS